VFTPKSEPREVLRAGEVGFIICGIKELQAAKVGDTLTLEKKLHQQRRPGRGEPLPGFKEIQPQVFAGCTPPRPASTTSCATRSRSSSSTTRACATSPR
jgi:GTP-binding protein LepA